jgi:hypothetical protein
VLDLAQIIFSYFNDNRNINQKQRRCLAADLYPARRRGLLGFWATQSNRLQLRVGRKLRCIAQSSKTLDRGAHDFTLFGFTASRDGRLFAQLNQIMISLRQREAIAQLVAFGGRSMSIWDADNFGLVWDSGDQFEQRTAAMHPTLTFNASNDNNSFDDRSPAKGPEPESVVTAKFGTKTFAFIGLERVGGVMVYDVSNPAAPIYVNYLNTRSGASGDRGPEGLLIIKAADSPTGKPLLIVSNETSGTTAVFQLNLQY